MSSPSGRKIILAFSEHVWWPLVACLRPVKNHLLTEKNAEDRDAGGVEGSEEWGGGISLPSRLGGLGERRQLPQRGPGRKIILAFSEHVWWPLVACLHPVIRNHLSTEKNYFSVAYKTGLSCRTKIKT